MFLCCFLNDINLIVNLILRGFFNLESNDMQNVVGYHNI